MKTFRRPMFRKGGSTNEGVMTGIRDRENFAIKGIDDATMEKIKAREDLFRSITAPRGGEALSNLLIRGGLNLISGTGEKGLRGVATAFQKPTEQFMQESAREDQFGRQLGLAAATGVLGERAKERLAILSRKNQMQKERRIAIANLNAQGIKNPTEDQILNEISNVASQTQKRFEQSIYQKDISDALSMPGINSPLAAKVYVDILRKFPKLGSQLNPNSPIVSISSKTGKSTQKEGIYIDLSKPGGAVVQVDKDGNVVDITATYIKPEKG